MHASAGCAGLELFSSPFSFFSFYEDEKVGYHSGLNEPELLVLYY